MALSLNLPVFNDAPEMWGPADEEQDDGHVINKLSRFAPDDWLAALQAEAEAAPQGNTSPVPGGFRTVANERETAGLVRERKKNAQKSRKPKAKQSAALARDMAPTKEQKNTKKTPWRRPPVVRRTTILLDDTHVLQGELGIEDISKSMEGTNVMPVGHDVSVCGMARELDSSIDGCSWRKPLDLPPKEQMSKIVDKYEFEHCLLLKDQAVRDIIRNYDTSSSKTVVVTTDVALAALMTAARSTNSWDVSAIKSGRFVIIDRRDASTEDAGWLLRQWVHETAQGDAPSDMKHDDPVSASSWANDSTLVDRTFRTMALTKKAAKMVGGKKNEMELTADKERTPTIYRYRRYTLFPKTEREYDVVVRCEVDAGMPLPKGEKEESRRFARIFTQLQFTSEYVKAWTAQVDERAGGLIAMESKANGCKFAKWAVLSMLAGVQEMKIAFAQRINVVGVERTDAEKKDVKSTKVVHRVVRVASFKPEEFGKTISVRMPGLWAAFDTVLSQLLSLRVAHEGQHVSIMRETQKQQLKFFTKIEHDDDTSSDDSSSEDSSDDSSSDDSSESDE